MSFPQLGYPQYLSASQAVYGSERPGVLTPSSRGGTTEIGGSPSATAAAVTSVLGMYANPYAHNYSAFLPYTSADLALFSQMVRINCSLLHRAQMFPNSSKMMPSVPSLLVFLDAYFVTLQRKLKNIKQCGNIIRVQSMQKKKKKQVNETMKVGGGKSR